jgi:hypothetical protein
VAKKKPAAPARKKSGGTTGMGDMGDMGSGASNPSPTTKTPFQFRGRSIQVMPPSARDLENARQGKPAQGILRIDGREVMYEQTDEGIYSHEMMYQRFSTPEELAEELVQQWGTHIPAPPPMSMKMPVPGAKGGAKGRKTASPRSRRK